MAAPRWRDLKRHIINTLGLIDQDLPAVVIGTALSTHIMGDPVWMYVSGPSGSGKTEILRLLHGPSIKQYTGFTAQALAGGYIKKDEEGRRISTSMLAQLHMKTLVIRDASQMVSLPPDQFKKVMGILRDAFDGSTTQGYGTGTIHIKCHLSIIAATTQAIEITIEQVDKAFGERFTTIKPIMRSREEHLEHAIMMAGRSHHWREELRNLTAEFIHENKPPVCLDDIECDIGDLCRMANFASAARTPVVRNKYRYDSIEAPPELEYGARLAKQLLKLGKITAWMGDNHHRIVKRTALSSIPIVRQRILKEVYEGNFRNVPQLEKAVKVSKRVVAMEADNLYHIGLLGRSQTRSDSKGRPNYIYTCDTKWQRDLGIMFSDKWMGMDDREAEEAQHEEDKKIKEKTGRKTVYIPMPDDFFPGEE
ncbi:MAG: hypothetical protein AMS21_01055 [Gemmatimonas sp. SG8_38_2]|nr:MAG: hypothetical protein AMS21_01055 [Gemmatimonas sp. SG8_38_2]